MYLWYMKNLIYLFIVIVIISCTVSIAYIHQPQEDAIIVLGTNTDSTSAGKAAEGMESYFKNRKDTIN